MPLYNLRGVDVTFPFEAYTCQVRTHYRISHICVADSNFLITQLTYMEKVIQALQERQNALLESPTGTGKTLCLLCATLAWRESVKKQLTANTPASAPAGGYTGKVMPIAPVPEQQPAPKLPLIIYSSRTHSQLAQVMRELKRTEYRIRASVLGSRQQLCQQPNIAKLPSASANAACKALVSNRGCEWYRSNRSGGNERFMEEAGNSVMDIEELARFGRSKRCCPFYMSRDLTEKADILFMPYNYLIDARSRRTLDGVAWEGAVLIFDEAHNVEGVCSDAASFDLSALQLASCVTEINRCRSRCLELAPSQPAGGAGLQGNGQGVDAAAAGTPNYRELYDKLGVIAVVLKRVEEEVARRAHAQPSGYTGAGLELLQLLSGCGITSTNWRLAADSLEAAIGILGEDEAEAGRSRASQKASTAGCHSVLEALTLAMVTDQPFNMRSASNSRGIPIHKGYRMHIHYETMQGAQVPILSYWCFIPGAAFAQLEALGVRCLLLTSGTLSPLESFAAELQLPFEVRLENPHIITKSQVWVGVVPTGPSGVSLNASYQSRSDPAYKEDLGNAIVNFARLVPDGLLVFFPSYGVLTACMEFWKTHQAGGTSTIWERIVQYKAPVVEPREASMFQASIDDFTAKLDAQGTSGAVFFAVCRGKVSEGLDFADRAGRAVIITGIPYASTAEPKVKLKRQVLTEERASGNGILGANVLSGDEWYTQQAARAVNQAIGRVIRHRNDYGAIILCDARFQGANTQRQLSMWLRDYVQVHTNFGLASASITKFFKDTASLPCAKAVAGRGPAAALPSGGAFEVLGGAGQVARVSKPPGPAALAAALRAFPTAMDTSGLSDLARPMAKGAAGSSVSGGSKSLLDMLAAGGGPRSSGESRPTAGPSAEPQDGSRLAALAAGAPPLGGAGGSGGCSSGCGRPPGLPSVSSVLGQVAVRPRPQRQDIIPPSAPAQLVVGPAHLVQAHQAALTAQTSSLVKGLGGGGPLGRPGSSAAAGAAAAPSGSNAPFVRTQRPAGNGLGTVAAGSRAEPSGSASQPPPPAAASASGSQREAAAGTDGRTAGDGTASTSGQGAAAGCAQPAPKDFMKQLERKLDKADWAKVKKLLADYRSSRNVEAFIQGIVMLLKGPATVQLLWGFTSFIPNRQQREWLERLIQSHMPPQAPPAAAPQVSAAQPGASGTAAAAASIPGSTAAILPQKRALQEANPNPTAGKKAALGAAASTNPTAGEKASLGVAAGANPGVGKKAALGAAAAAGGAACGVCGARPMDAPYKSPCGHMACYSCWVLRLSKLQQCVTCQQPCRKKQLTPCFFM